MIHKATGMKKIDRWHTDRRLWENEMGGGRSSERRNECKIESASIDLCEQ